MAPGNTSALASETGGVAEVQMLLLTAFIDERRDETEQIHAGTTLDLSSKEPRINMCYLAHSKCASSTECAKNEFHSCWTD